MIFKVYREADSGTVHRIPNADGDGWRELFRRDMPPARAIVHASSIDDALRKARKLYGRGVVVTG